jgi:hypothetical protein
MSSITSSSCLARESIRRDFARTMTQPDKYYGIGAVNYHTGETVVQFQRRKRAIRRLPNCWKRWLRSIRLGQSLSPGITLIPMRMMKWKKSCVQRLDGLSCSTCQRTVPGSIPLKCVFRHFRREVTHCELFETKQALLTAAQECFARFNRCPKNILSVIGSNAQKVS